MCYDWMAANMDCQHDPRAYEFLEADDCLYRDRGTDGHYRLIFFRCPSCAAERRNCLVFLVRTQDLMLVNPRNALQHTERPSEE